MNEDCDKLQVAVPRLYEGSPLRNVSSKRMVDLQKCSHQPKDVSIASWGEGEQLPSNALDLLCLTKGLN